MAQGLPPVNVPAVPVAPPVYAGNNFLFVVAACVAAIALFVLHQLRSRGAASTPQQETSEEGSEKPLDETVVVIKEELETVAINYSYLITNDMAVRIATIKSNLNASNVIEACKLLNEMKSKAPEVLTFSVEAERILLLYRRPLSQSSCGQSSTPSAPTPKQLEDRRLIDQQKRDCERNLEIDRERERGVKTFPKLEKEIRTDLDKHFKIIQILDMIRNCILRYKQVHKINKSFLYYNEIKKMESRILGQTSLSELKECPKNIYDLRYKQAVHGCKEEIKNEEYQKARTKLDEAYNEYVKDIKYIQENFGKKAEWEEILKNAPKKKETT